MHMNTVHASPNVAIAHEVYARRGSNQRSTGYVTRHTRARASQRRVRSHEASGVLRIERVMSDDRRCHNSSVKRQALYRRMLNRGTARMSTRYGTGYMVRRQQEFNGRKELQVWEERSFCSLKNLTEPRKKRYVVICYRHDRHGRRRRAARSLAVEWQ